MKLHYSQTIIFNCRDLATVLLPYEITLLSNTPPCTLSFLTVLLPYEITLLSNRAFEFYPYEVVLLPYEITLLSN